MHGSPAVFCQINYELKTREAICLYKRLQLSNTTSSTPLILQSVGKIET